MSINITNFAWVAFIVLSILMGGSIGRSYMWLVASGIIAFLLFYKRGKVLHLNRLVREYNSFIVYCLLNTFFYLGITGFKSNIYIKSQLIEMLLLAFAASYLTSYYANSSFVINWVKKIGWILMLAGVAEEVTKFNITQYIGNQDYVAQYLVKEGRIISVFSHPIGYAIILTFFFLIALYFPYKSKNKQNTYILLVLINLLCTKTRMAMIAVVIITLIYLAKHNMLKNLFSGKVNYTKNSLIYLAIIFLLAFACIVIFHNKISIFAESIVYRIVQMFTGSEQGIRLGVIANYFTGLRENSVPMIIFGKGTGYASFYMIENPIYYWNEFGDKVAWGETTDNMYITILMNYGVVGLFLFLRVLISAIKRIIHETDNMVLFGCSGLIAVFFDLFFFEGLYWPVIMNVIGIYMAFITKGIKTHLKIGE